MKKLFSNIKGDAFGGITAGIVALPLALAFGVSSGLGPSAGLYGAIFISFFAALFGGTNTQISGPTAPMTAVSMVVIAGIVAANDGDVTKALPAILTIFILDRCSKILVINNFNKKEYFINDYLNIDLIWNTGVGFGLLSSGTSLIYNTITFLIIMIIFVLIYVAIRSKYLDKLIFSLIIGGALGNLFDRITYNAVPDFIDLHYNNFHWFVFNIADIFITLGVALYFMKGFFEKN